jgi:hypothetical protein
MTLQGSAESVNNIAVVAIVVAEKLDARGKSNGPLLSLAGDFHHESFARHAAV